LLGKVIGRFLAEADLLPTTVAVYERTLAALLADLGDVAVETVTRERLETHLSLRYAHVAAATYNRQLAAVGSLFSWCVDHDLIAVSPAARIRRRKPRRTRTQELQAQAIAYEQLRQLWGGPPS